MTTDDGYTIDECGHIARYIRLTDDTLPTIVEVSGLDFDVSYKIINGERTLANISWKRESGAICYADAGSILDVRPGEVDTVRFPEPIEPLPLSGAITAALRQSVDRILGVGVPDRPIEWEYDGLTVTLTVDAH